MPTVNSKTLPAKLVVDERKLCFGQKCFCLQMWFLGQFHVPQAYEPGGWGLQPPNSGKN